MELVATSWTKWILLQAINTPTIPMRRPMEIRDPAVPEVQRIQVNCSTLIIIWAILHHRLRHLSPALGTHSIFHLHKFILIKHMKYSELEVRRQRTLYSVIRRPTTVQLHHLRQRQHMDRCHQWSVPYRRIVLSTSPSSTLIPLISIITELFITRRLELLSTLRVHITPAHHFIALKIVIINSTMDIWNHWIPLLAVMVLLEKLVVPSTGWLDRHRTIQMDQSIVLRMDLSHLNMKREIV